MTKKEIEKISKNTLNLYLEAIDKRNIEESMKVLIKTAVYLYMFQLLEVLENYELSEKTN